MKICLIGTVASSTLNFRKTFIEILIKDGHDVFVFATDYTTETKSSISNLGATPIDYNLNRGGLNPLSDIKNTLNLTKKLKKIQPDIVFSYFAKPVIFGTLAAKIAKTPRIVGMLEGLGYTFTATSKNKKEPIKKKIIREIQVFLYKIALPYLDRLVFLNNDDPIDLLQKRKITVKDIKVLGGIGVDLEKFNYTAPSISPIRFLFIGRLLEEKGIREFLDSAVSIKKIYPDVEFIVLGSPDPENPTSIKKSELNKLVSEKIIIYPGHVSDVKCWLDQCSVFVLPSYREGLPCSTQEAMACGRAIITTNVPGCKETVTTSNGFLVSPYDSMDLAKKMEALINNKDLLLNFGTNSRKIAEEKFNAKKQSENLKKILLS